MRIILTCVGAMLLCVTAPLTAQVPPKLAPPVEKGRWIMPADGAAEPIWGIKGGIAVGLWPTGGPRGLLRIYAPYLGHPPGRMINFIAVEPVVGGSRGLSELERSRLEQMDGKSMWTADDFENDPKPRKAWQPAQGRIIGSGNAEALVFYVYVERFDNGAQPIVKVMLRQDRPYEVSLTTYPAKNSAAMGSCVLTATMGNFGRLRDLWLKGEVVRSTLVYRSAGLGDNGFTSSRQWEQERLLSVGSEVIVAATPNEPDPAKTNVQGMADGWRYLGQPATQYWKTEPRNGTSTLVVRVNGRRTYWPDRTGSQGLIPGGVAYENFELEAPFRAGQEFRFGVTPQQPEALGFPSAWRGNITDGGPLPNSADNLEVVVREGNALVHYWAPPGRPWIRAVALTAEATGAGAIARNRNGNLEVTALQGGSLVHYWAVPGKPWNRGPIITTRATGLGAIIQSSSGNLEVVVQEGSNLVHYWAVPGQPWNRAATITTKATGPGSITQGKTGNLEVVVLEGNSLVHYWAVPGKPWNRAAVITTKATGAGAIARGQTGNLEVVVQEGNTLVHYWTIPGKPWTRAAVITANATGPGSIAQGPAGNLEVVVLEGSNLVHYWAALGKPWTRAAAITTKATGTGSFIQIHP